MDANQDTAMCKEEQEDTLNDPQNVNVKPEPLKMDWDDF